MQKRLKIIAADRPAGVETLQKILSDIALVVPVLTMEEAERAVRGDFDLVICGIHFADSRTFDLLSYVRQLGGGKVGRFLIYRDLAYKLDATFFRSLEISAEVSGAAGFVDLYSLKQSAGVKAADDGFRSFVCTLASAYERNH